MDFTEVAGESRVLNGWRERVYLVAGEGDALELGLAEEGVGDL